MISGRACFGWLACGLLASAPALAVADSQRFDIPAQPLPAALKAFAAQAHIQLFYVYSVVANARGKAIQGELDTHEALEELLRDTGLQAVYQSDSEVTIRPADAPQSSEPAVQKRPAKTPRLGQSDPHPAEDSTASSVKLEEVIVTSQKREERLQDVPIPVTAITASDLAEESRYSLQDYYSQVPGLSLTPNEFSGAPTIAIRGITSGDFTNPTVGITVDDVPFGPSTVNGGGYFAPDLDPSDLARIEVLRGPQGTLYGRNATGGAIVVNTTAPTDKMEGYALAEYGRFDHILGEGVINLPVSDTLAIRFAGRYTKEDGYIHNLTTGRDGPDRRAHVIRGSMAWRPSSDFSAVLTIEHSRDRSEAFPQAQRIGAPLCLGCTISGEGAVTGFYDARNDPTEQDSLAKSFSATLRIRANSGIFDIDSVTAYRNLTSDSENDIDATSVDLFNAISLLGGKTYSQDLVVSSNSGSWLDGIVGLSFVKDDAFQRSRITGLAVAALPEVPFIENRVNTESVAAFAQMTAKPVTNLEITLGGRYSYDDRDLKARENLSANLAFAGGTGLLAFNQHASFRSFTPRAVIAYTAGNFNLYGSYNRGFKAGGFSIPLYSPGNPVKPEKLDSFEAGIKFVSADHKLNVNLAAFYYRHKDLQVRVADLAAGGAAVRNAASARGRGVELEFDYTPVTGLKIYGGGSYLRARFRDFEGATVNSAVGGVLVTTTEDLSGTRVPNAPKFTGFLGTSIEQPIGGSWMAALNGVVRYSSGYDFFPGAGGNLRLDKQDAYTVANVSGHVGPANGAYEIGFYVNNLFNEKYSINWQTSAPFGSAQVVAKPRTYGVRLKYSF